jgi:hypothetical protein
MTSGVASLHCDHLIGRRCDEHALILAANLYGKVIRRNLRRRCACCIGCSMRGFNTALEHGQHVVRQHRDGKAERRGTWMTQGADRAVQDRLESLEHAFDTSALAIESGDLVWPTAAGRLLLSRITMSPASVGCSSCSSMRHQPCSPDFRSMRCSRTSSLDARSFHPWLTAG